VLEPKPNSTLKNPKIHGLSHQNQLSQEFEFQIFQPNFESLVLRACGHLNIHSLVFSNMGCYTTPMAI
jgi:hypothetical protein